MGNKTEIATPTDLEVAIVQCLSEDNTVEMLAKETGTNVRTMEGKVANLKAKYGLRTLAGLCALFFRQKWID